jgi:chemotaxis protein MotB
MKTPNHRLPYALALSALLLAMTGCVTRKQYDQLAAQSQTLQGELNERRQHATQCDGERDSLSQRLSDLEQENSALRNANQVLASKNRTLATEMTSVRNASLEIRKEVEQKERALDVASQTYADLVNSLKQEVDQGQVTIREMRDQLEVSLVERIVFPAGEIDLNPEGRALLNKVAKILKTVKGRRIEVQGHSDNSPVAANMRDAFPTNWEVSARRATSVVRYLQERGVAADRLAAVALSSYHPIADNKSAAGRNRNRRIEIVLTPLLTERGKDSRP